MQVPIHYQNYTRMKRYHPNYKHTITFQISIYESLHIIIAFYKSIELVLRWKLLRIDLFEAVIYCNVYCFMSFNMILRECTKLLITRLTDLLLTIIGNRIYFRKFIFLNKWSLIWQIYPNIKSIENVCFSTKL